VISILKSGSDRALAASYRPISFFDKVGKLFEKILQTRLLQLVNERGMFRVENLGLERDIAQSCTWPATLKE
jgi:hypothetical protein